MNLKNKNDIDLLDAIEKKDYISVNSFVTKGIKLLNSNSKNSYEITQNSRFINELKFSLRILFLDKQFSIAENIMNLFKVERTQKNGEAIITKQDIADIAEYLIINKSDSIHFFWDQYFNKEKSEKKLLIFAIAAINVKNTNFLSSYSNIKNLFKSDILLKNCINSSFTKTYNDEFFSNLSQYYAVFNPEFKFRIKLLKALKHQLLIRNVDNISTEHFQHIENIYEVCFPYFYDFKLFEGLGESLKKKPENNEVFSEYLKKLISQNDLSVVKEHGSSLLKKNPQLNNKFKLFNKLNKNLINKKQIISVKNINKI